MGGLDVRAYGDVGVLARVTDDDYETRWRRTQGLATALREARPPWLVDLVATYDHLFVTFDPAVVDHAAVADSLTTLDDGEEVAPGRVFEVPVLFGGEAGPDLEDVAAEVGLDPEALVARLTEKAWRVRFVAGPVGTPFTDRADWRAAVPRVREPRVAVPAGSLALSGAQCIIYPLRSPGGWRLVGRTPLRLVATDPDADELVAYRAGDELHYVAIDASRYAELEGTRL